MCGLMIVGARDFLLDETGLQLTNINAGGGLATSRQISVATLVVVIAGVRLSSFCHEKPKLLSSKLG